MAKKTSIKRDYKRMNKAMLVNKAKMVLSSMTGNIYYPAPLPQLADLNTGIEKYEDAINAAQYGDRVKILLQNLAGKSLIALLDQLADYVTLVSNGDRVIMATSGFTLSSEHNKSSELGEVENFVVEQGKNSGEAKAKVGTVKDAKFYLFLINEGVATVDTPGWEEAEGRTRRTVTISDLKVATLYSFYVKVYGSNGQETQSKIITRMFL